MKETTAPTAAIIWTETSKVLSTAYTTNQSALCDQNITKSYIASCKKMDRVINMTRNVKGLI